MLKDAERLQTIIALQESAYLRSRCSYLLASIASLEPDPLILERVGIHSLLDYIKQKDQPLAQRLLKMLDGVKQPRCAVISSSRIGGDVYRAPDTTTNWHVGEDARKAITDLLSHADGKAKLGDGEDVIVASPPIPIASGSAPSIVPPGTQNPARAAQEFMYVNLQIPNRKQNNQFLYKADDNHSYAEADIAIFLAVRPSTNRPWSVHALPGDIRLLQSRILIRLNAWGLLEVLALARQPEICLFLAGWRNQ